ATQRRQLGEQYLEYSAGPFELLTVERAEIFRDQAAADDLRKIDRSAAPGVNPYRRHQIFGEPDAMSANRQKRGASKGTVRANRDGGSMAEQAHLPWSV